MSTELEHDQPQEEGLSTGAQLGLAAFFVGLPFLEMGVTAIGLGETGMVVAGLAAGGLGIGTKFLVDHKKPGDDSQPGQRFTQRLVEATGLDRLQHADWSALLRSVDAPVSTRESQPKEATTDDEIIDAEPLVEEDELFSVDASADTGGIARLTIEQIVRNCQMNSYKIFIGRSMTKPGNKAVLINFYKQHFRFIGASQRGKSSMVAAFLEIVTRTHDPKHVRLILLDKEDRTSKLFAHLPHVLTMRKQDGSKVKLHARNVDQVLAYLIHSVAIMEHRLTLPTSKILEMPVILVYLEEFLRVKDELKIRINQAKDKAAKDAATSDYETFMYCIKALAQQSLKVRMQLLICAQTEYADEDFREAMANIGCGFSFCVRPSVANSAGFRNNNLLQKNAEANKVGQAVVETPDCNDIILAPESDLELRLLEFEKTHPDIHPIHGESEIEVASPQNELTSDSPVNAVNTGEPLRKPVNASVNAGEYSPVDVNIHARYTLAEETQVLLAYAEMEKAGEKITRTGIRDYLNWNSRQYERIVKPVCDKHNIG